MNDKERGNIAGYEELCVLHYGGGSYAFIYHVLHGTMRTTNFKPWPVWVADNMQ